MSTDIDVRNTIVTTKYNCAIKLRINIMMMLIIYKKRNTIKILGGTDVGVVVLHVNNINYNKIYS